MAKFNEGDKLETTESFGLHGGRFIKGDVWEVTQVDAYSGNYYTVAHENRDLEYVIPHEKLDTETRLRKVWKFNEGDAVYLLEGAHGSDGTVGSTPEAFIANLRAHHASFDHAWRAVTSVDSEGDVHISQGDTSVYVLEEFLTKEKPDTNSSAQGVTPTEVETVEVAKLLEANEFLGHIEQDFLMELVNLAQRLK